MQRKFWVIFTHGHNRERVARAMNGPTARSVAREVREKYRDVNIESIHAIRSNVSTLRRG